MQERAIHRFYEAGVLLKGAHALFELLAAVLLYTVDINHISSAIIDALHSELLEDPHDALSNALLPHTQTLGALDTHFAAWYLLWHGVIKLVLVAGLLRERAWAYPASLAALGVFVAYQCYRFTLTHSPFMLVLTLFDLAVMWLIWKEYSFHRRRMSVGKEL